MCFDDIPEDLRETYPCPEGACAGNVTKNTEGYWECDTCDWCSVEV